MRPPYIGQYFSQLLLSEGGPLAHWNPTQLASGHSWPAVVKVVTIALGLMLETLGTAGVLPDIAVSANEGNWQLFRASGHFAEIGFASRLPEK